MRFNSWLATLTVGALAAAAPGLFASAHGPASASAAPVTNAWGARADASGLLNKLDNNAIQVRGLAANLQSLDRQDNDNFWQYDAHLLNRARAKVNVMDRDLHRLERIEDQAAPWQQDAVNRLAPSVVELSDSTQAAIHYLNHHHGYLYAPSYRNDANFMYMKANTIANSVNQFEEYASSRREMRQLGTKLGISS